MTEQGNLMESTRYHPGTMVSEYLEFNEWTQRELARRTGLTPKTVNEICNGKARISPTTALAFERVFHRPAHFWLNLQTKYDEIEARQLAMDNLLSWREWANRFPIADMKRFRFLDVPSKDETSVTSALLSFFGVSSPESWQSVWRTSPIAYRQTLKPVTSKEAISAWLRATELEANRVSTSPFDEHKLRLAIPELRRQTREGPQVFIPELQRLCAAAGVAVVWIPELPQTGISGCSRWLTGHRALIALTLRYKTDDQMWFTFFHEVGHILLHRQRHMLILDNATEDLLDRTVDPEMQQIEEEASRFAADTLIPPESLSQFIRRKVFTNASIKAFADALTIGPGIMVGRLQHEGVLKHFQGNQLKRNLHWAGLDE